MNRTWRARARRMLAGTIGAAGVVGLVGCGVPRDGRVRTIDEVPFGLANVPTSATTTTTTIPTIDQTTTSLPTSTIATEDVRLYFISGGQLNAVSVPLARTPSASQVIAALLNGPPDGEAGLGLRSALWASSLIVVGDDATGVAAVDLPNGFFDTIPAPDQRLAIGQIVLTLLDRPGLGQIVFSQRGMLISVPLASNEPAPPGRALTKADYLPLLQTPGVSTTSTSDPAPPDELEPLDDPTDEPADDPADGSATRRATSASDAANADIAG